MQIVLKDCLKDPNRDGRAIITAFRAALYDEPRDRNRPNRRWEVKEFKHRVECAFSTKQEATLVASVGVIARLQRAHMDEWCDVWPAEVRDLQLMPINPPGRYSEIGIKIGMISEEQEAVVLDLHPHVRDDLQALLQRFRAKLYGAVQATAAAQVVPWTAFFLPKKCLHGIVIRARATNAEVHKNEGETAVNLIRRFSKRVQGAGLIPRMRGRRYFARPKSPLVRRKQTLKVIKRREEVKELIKLGKMLEKPQRGPRRR
jgi:ribosomal protein S21